MPPSLSLRCAIFLLLAISVTITMQHTEPKVNADIPESNIVRAKRYVRKPGFFWTIGSAIFQQYNETKSAISQINNLINDQFVDPRKPVPETSTNSDSNASTTEAPYRITRAEFNRILMRNLRGISRLYNLELAAALKQSERTRAEFNKQLRTSIKQELS